MAKKPIDPIKAKQRKQKKMAIGGGVLLLLLVVVQGPKLLKQVHGGNQTPSWLAQSRQQTASGVTPAPAVGAPAATTPGVAPPVSPGAPATAAPSAGAPLVADAAPAAGFGQLATFSGLASKDPFAAQVPLPTAAASGPQCAAGALADTADCPPAGSSTGGSAAGGTASKPPTPPSPGSGAKSGAGSSSGGSAPSSGSTPPVPAPTSAVISVNGVKGLVAVGADFPADAPFFHLVSAGAHTAKISIAGGSYASGAASLTLHERKPVTLMNTADGTRYTLELFPPGTPVAVSEGPAATTGSSASTSPTTTAATTTASK
jgi:hypothetical protein